MAEGSKARTLAEIGDEVARVGAVLRDDPTAMPGGAIVAALVQCLRRCCSEALKAKEKVKP